MCFAIIVSRPTAQADLLLVRICRSRAGDLQPGTSLSSTAASLTPQAAHCGCPRPQAALDASPSQVRRPYRRTEVPSSILPTDLFGSVPGNTCDNAAPPDGPRRPLLRRRAAAIPDQGSSLGRRGPEKDTLNKAASVAFSTLAFYPPLYSLFSSLPLRCSSRPGLFSSSSLPILVTPSLSLPLPSYPWGQRESLPRRRSGSPQLDKHPSQRLNTPHDSSLGF